jgi:enoyl-CoA hydratase
MSSHISLKIDDRIGYLTITGDPPGKPATLDHDVLNELDARLDELYAQVRELRAVVLQSASKKYFVVGANINALKTLNSATIIPWVKHGHRVFNKLERLLLPVIAKVEGFALGGGLELAMACDIIIASNSAKFGQPEARLGFVAGWGGSYRLPKRVGIAKAKELFFTGKVIDAQTALGIGLVNFVGDSGEVDSYLNTLLQDINQCSPTAVSWMKRLIESSSQTSIEENCMSETVASSECLATEDTQNRVSTFLAERKKKQGE